MPELPEVETYRRYFEATSLHQPIEAIEVEDRKLLTTDYATLTETLIGQTFTDTKRVGKNLFVLTDKGSTVHFHFGMTGDLEYYHSSLDRPRHARIVFHFRGGYNLGFVCPRKFERIGLVENIEEYLKRKKIAPDGLEISLIQLTENLRKRKSFIKPVLLDQSTVAGIGNWIVDEVLFQAKIHPEQPAYLLNDDEIERIHTAIVYVLQTAITHEANYGLFPKSFLIHAREWATSPYNDPQRHLCCPCDKVTVAQIRVGGRATYFCPSCQVLR
jgi:formamidopyrimidine-DNA glycosylase